MSYVVILMSFTVIFSSIGYAHTDEQNLYFDNFFYDKCTCSKAGMLVYEQVHLSQKKLSMLRVQTSK
jgi:hypothetical protein